MDDDAILPTAARRSRKDDPGPRRSERVNHNSTLKLDDPLARPAVAPANPGLRWGPRQRRREADGQWSSVGPSVATGTATGGEALLATPSDELRAQVSVVRQAERAFSCVWRSAGRGTPGRPRLSWRHAPAMERPAEGPTRRGQIAARDLHDTWKRRFVRRGVRASRSKAHRRPHDLLTGSSVTQAPFTGAAGRARGGAFRRADGGTLFLGEISDLPLELQSSHACGARPRRRADATGKPVGNDTAEAVDDPARRQHQPRPPRDGAGGHIRLVSDLST